MAQACRVLWRAATRPAVPPARRRGGEVARWRSLLLPADGDDPVLRVGHRDVRGLPVVVVVGEAVLLAVDGAGVPELRVVVRRGGLVEVRRVGLLGRRQLRYVPVETCAQRRVGGKRAAAAEDLRGAVGGVTDRGRVALEVAGVGAARLEGGVVAR